MLVNLANRSAQLNISDYGAWLNIRYKFVRSSFYLFMCVAGEFTECVIGRGYVGHIAEVSQLDPSGLYL